MISLPGYPPSFLDDLKRLAAPFDVELRIADAAGTVEARLRYVTEPWDPMDIRLTWNPRGRFHYVTIARVAYGSPPRELERLVEKRRREALDSVFRLACLASGVA